MQTVKSRDEELVELYLRSGERVHLEELTERHLARIRTMVYSMLLNHVQADDVTQEIFLKVYRGLPAFEGRSKFTTWLYRIAVNTVHSHLDRQNRSPVSFQTNVPEPAETAKPGESLAEQEIHNRLEAALAVSEASSQKPEEQELTKTLLDLLELNVSNAKNIAVVERMQIDKIL